MFLKLLRETHIGRDEKERRPGPLFGAEKFPGWSVVVPRIARPEKGLGAVRPFLRTRNGQWAFLETFETVSMASDSIVSSSSSSLSRCAIAESAQEQKHIQNHWRRTVIQFQMQNWFCYRFALQPEHQVFHSKSTLSLSLSIALSRRLAFG